MNEEEIKRLLYTKPKDKLVEMFDNMTCVPIMYLFTSYDIQYLYDIATSRELTSKPKTKYKLIDSLMKPKGFIRLHAGTNRIVYRHLDINTFVAKIAIDDVGLGDNPAEFKNQHLLKPFVAKTFEVTSNGVLAFSERVEPITSLASFLLISPDAFDVLVYKILGKYVIDDVGSDYFMNWGVRKGVGPCLLDYPYVYNLDSNKLYCNKPIYPNTKFPVCGGEIDYDEGFNNLVCTICGKHYIAKDLAEDIKNNLVYFKGGFDMEVRARIKIYKNGKLVSSSVKATESIVNDGSGSYDFTNDYFGNRPKIRIKKNGIIVAGEGRELNTDMSKIKDMVPKIKIKRHNQNEQQVQEECKEVTIENIMSSEPKVNWAPKEDHSNNPQPTSLMEARMRLAAKNKEEVAATTLPPIPDGLVVMGKEKPIPVINLNDKEEVSEVPSVVYDMKSNQQLTIKTEHVDPLMQGMMAGIGVDTICGIVSGISDEERKIREKEQEAAAKAAISEETSITEEEEVVINNDISYDDPQVVEEAVIEEEQVVEETAPETEVQEEPQVEEEVDLSVLKGFKPGISSSKETNVVYTTAVDREAKEYEKDELKDLSERRLQFFKSVDNKLNHIFERNSDKNDTEEIIEICYNELKEYVRKYDKENFFNYSYNEYIEAFINNADYSRNTIDILDPIANNSLLDKY